MPTYQIRDVDYDMGITLESGESADEALLKYLMNQVRGAHNYSHPVWTRNANGHAPEMMLSGRKFTAVYHSERERT
jgi:hypothetical protein